MSIPSSMVVEQERRFIQPCLKLRSYRFRSADGCCAEWSATEKYDESSTTRSLNVDHKPSSLSRFSCCCALSQARALRIRSVPSAVFPKGLSYVGILTFSQVAV